MSGSVEVHVVTPEREIWAGQDAEVAVDPAGGDEVGLAGPHLPLGGDQVDLQVGHGYSPPSDLAFSSASSIPPTLKKACSGRWS